MAYTLTIRGLSSKEDARKIAEDFFGVMMWKHEAGCMTCWPQRDEHPLTITDSAADGKIIADIRADLARVTAERDDYRERWEQTGCTRHHAMETAIKLQESRRQQLEAVIQERDAALAENDGLRWVLRQIVSDLPARRDWLDPDVERAARAALKQG